MQSAVTVNDELLRPDKNNLTLVRLILASAVIWTHSVWFVTGHEGTDELSGLLGAPISTFAVDGFFFLSGYLVYASLMRRNSAVDFLTARLARLWPGMAMAVMVIAATGFFITTASARGYFGGATAKFLLGNLSLTFGSYTLTGVTCGGNLCNVNGSLWTITWEARCYLVLAALFIVGLAQPRLMKIAILPATAIGVIVLHLPPVAHAMKAHLGTGLLYNVAIIDRLWAAFALGIAAHLWRDRIVLTWWLLAGLFLTLILTQRFMPLPHLATIAAGYLVLCGGFLTARRRSISGAWPDFSYGIYIYAFPAMMVVGTMIPLRSHLLLALATFAATLPVAALSWYGVERPVLELVRRRRTRPEDQPRHA